MDYTYFFERFDLNPVILIFFGAYARISFCRVKSAIHRLQEDKKYCDYTGIW
jgi:hypothetical protein